MVVVDTVIVPIAFPSLEKRVTTVSLPVNESEKPSSPNVVEPVASTVVVTFAYSTFDTLYLLETDVVKSRTSSKFDVPLPTSVTIVALSIEKRLVSVSNEDDIPTSPSFVIKLFIVSVSVKVIVRN